MARVLKTINDNFACHSFDVGYMHEHLGMSKAHLTRKLKVLTGLAPATLIRNIRLEKAAELLMAKAGNITEIANSVGISNPSNFTKAFRSYFGVSPKDYSKK
jgi:AraC-like DNA-binding protein